MAQKNKISKERAEEIIKDCYTIADFCRKVGWVPRGDNYKVVHKYIREYNLDVSHFTWNKSNIGNKLNKHNEVELKKLKNPLVKGSILLKKLISEGHKERKCECCGNKEWNNNPIPLEIHHINGNNSDNNIDNLQLLCPNCHALMDNYRGRKNKKEKKRYFCKKCGKEITRYSKSGLCVICCKKNNKNFLNKEKLKKILKKYNFTKVGKMYNVSDNAVRKWCKKYGLSTHIKDYK